MKDIITQCCECKKIKLDNNTWLSESDDKKKYLSLLGQYSGNISHEYCPPCYEQARNLVRNFKG